MFRPPAWVTGGLSAGDAEFLGELVARVQPTRVLEVGVAAGTSSAALLYALDQLPEGKRALVSVDIRPTCYFDARRATGEACAAMYPAPRARWILLTGIDARRVRRELTQRSIDLVFLDGDHSHPWPLLDVLHLAPWAQPEAWMALHDIALARVCPRFQTFGAEWLFAAWPGEKYAGTGDAENIGAVRLPANLETLVPMAIELVRRDKWETAIRDVDVDLPAVFASVAAALRPRLGR